jgi:polyhydroxybutyrate depolymerase
MCNPRGLGLVLFCFTVFFASHVMGEAHLVSGDHTRTLDVGDRTRSYLVHIPPKYDSKQPTPVVLAFHGGTGNASVMARFCGLNDKANSENFIVVYPNGTGRSEGVLTWNGGNCCGYAQWNNVDDVGFTRALLDDLAKVVNVDAKRVFATGMSNGGIMCYRLASELSDRIASIAPISGTMGTATCNPKRPVSVMHFHGTDDDFVPFKGGKGTYSITQTNFYSVEHSIKAWVKADSCPEKPVVSDMPTKIDDSTIVQIKTYGPGKEETEVILVVINGGGHAWPGRERGPAFYFGKSTKNISANDMMWEFFKRHPMK